MVQESKPSPENNYNYSKFEINERKKLESNKPRKSNEKSKTIAQKNKLKFHRSLYGLDGWNVLNKIIPLIEEYSRTRMYKGREDLSEHELLATINKDLLIFKNKFVSDCCSLGIPKYFVKKMRAYDEICSITHSYSVYGKNSGYNPNNPKIYYKNAPANMNTRPHINKFSRFKMKLRQVSSCSMRKSKNTPFMMCGYDYKKEEDSEKKEEPMVSNQ